MKCAYCKLGNRVDFCWNARLKCHMFILVLLSHCKLNIWLGLFGYRYFQTKMKCVGINKFQLARTLSVDDMKNNEVSYWKSWQLVCGLHNPARCVPYRTGGFPIYGTGLNPCVSQWTPVVNTGLELKAVLKVFNYNRSQSFILYFKVQGTFFFSLMFTRTTACECAQIMSMWVSLLFALLCQKDV